MISKQILFNFSRSNLSRQQKKKNDQIKTMKTNQIIEKKYIFDDDHWKKNLDQSQGGVVIGFSHFFHLILMNVIQDFLQKLMMTFL